MNVNQHERLVFGTSFQQVAEILSCSEYGSSVDPVHDADADSNPDPDPNPEQPPELMPELQSPEPKMKTQAINTDTHTHDFFLSTYTIKHIHTCTHTH